MPQFEKRAIAFLDVLGFSELTRSAEIDPTANARMDELVGMLDHHVSFDPQTYASTVPVGAAPRHTFVSDSIIISARLDGGENIDGLATVIAKSIQVAHKLFEIGHIVRGGVSVGTAAHAESNIFGTGYIEAFQAEQLERGPRVVLTPSAASHWRSLPFYSRSLLVRMDSADAIIDTLHTYYIAGNDHHGRIEQAYRTYNTWIEQNLATLDTTKGPWKNWNGMRRLFEEAKNRHQVDI